MRHAAKIDSNHRDIVDALRNVGASVQSLAAVGQGVTDVLVGFRGVNYLMEIKDGKKPPSARKLTPAQHKWHAAWRGDVRVVKNIQEALMVIGVIREKQS